MGVLHDISNRSQLPSVSFWAAAPHYLPAGVNPKATLALVQRISAFLGTDVDVTDLLPSVEAWEERVSELIAENNTLTEYVQRLEEAATDQIQMGNLPSGETLAAEVERFLREHGSS